VESTRGGAVDVHEEGVICSENSRVESQNVGVRRQKTEGGCSDLAHGIGLNVKFRKAASVESHSEYDTGHSRPWLGVALPGEGATTSTPSMSGAGSAPNNIKSLEAFRIRY